jgi:glycosyltransferase involved in cell wall biosynthesis
MQAKLVSNGVYINITLFRDFVEDGRLSMEVYADGLGRALRAHAPRGYQVNEFRPFLPSWLGTGPWALRLARFGVYPRQARRQQGQINHILDHGYGHLLYVLDPERTVVTVHDLIPLVRWRGGGSGLAPGRKPWLNLFSFNALRRARYLIADSENTRTDLIRFCHCSPEEITVVYPGVNSMFRPYSPVEKSRARQVLGLPGDVAFHVLIMGSQIYKNQKGALRAFAQLRQIFQKPLRLLKIGLPNEEWRGAVHQFGLSETARCLGIIQRDKLPDLYNSVDCLLFPSLYEGFGWPPLEAMACGTPVVASNAGALPEVIGNAGLMYPPDDYKGLAAAMYAVLTDEGLCQSLVEKGLARARQFTWEETAQKTLEVYERVANGSHS